MKHLLFLVFLCLFSHFLFAQDEQSTLMQAKNNGYSEQLIKRFNQLRNLKSLHPIKHDTLLDLVTNEILGQPAKYQKSFNSFYEDSVRFLLFKSGVIDYKYELLEVTDKDTVSAFKKFFIYDHSKNIQVGCSKKEGKKLLIKTKGYLEYGYANLNIHSESIDSEQNSSTTRAKIFTDSIQYHVKALVPGKYRFYYSDKIPLSSEKSEKHDFMDIIPGEATNHFSDGKDYSVFNLVIDSRQPNKFVVVIDKNKNRVALVK